MNGEAGSGASRSDWLLAIAVAAALVIILTYPTVPALLTHGRLDSGDGKYSIWNIGWIGHALLTDPRHLFDANIFYPAKGTLAYSELNLVAGVLGLPVYALTRNAVAATNFAIAVGLWLAFLLVWTLVRRLTGSSTAGLIAATGFAFCPYVQVHTTHIQLLMVFGIPLAFLAFHRLHAKPGPWSAVMLGLAVATMGLACAYYGIYGGLALVVFALCMAMASRRYWSALATAAVVTLLAISPVFVPYLTVRHDAGSTSTYAPADVQTYSATGRTYLSSPARAHAALPKAAESVFPGFIPIGLAVTGAVVLLRSSDRRRRRLAWAYIGLAAFAVWASFGPAGGLYRVLMELPVVGMLRAPVRFGIVVAFAVAVLAGFGAAALARRRPALAMALVPLVALELWSSWGLRPTPPVPEAYRMLATLPRAPLIKYHMPYLSSDHHQNTWPMFWSTYHWQPLVNGYSDLVPHGYDEFARAANDFPGTAASFDLLRSRGVRYVVFDMEDYQGAARDTLASWFPAHATCLRRLTTDQDVWLFEIVAWPPACGSA